MRNIALSFSYKQLYFKLAQFIFSDNRIHSIAAIENLKKEDDEKSNICDFAKICKNFSLPVTMLDRDFQILSQGESISCFSQNLKEYDLVVSLFNLHNYSEEQRIKFIREMKQIAKKALFLEYENPERNLAYLGYLPILFGQYATFYYEKYKLGKKETPFAQMKNYFSKGALEGVLYDLPTILPNNTITLLERKNLGLGGIGFAYVEWN